MDIVSFEKISLQDYPEKIATICFTKGCQLRCPYCHNPNLVLPEMFISSPEDIYAEFIEYIDKRKNLIQGVVLSGGEPLMQKGLIDFIRKIKEFGLDVKLDTNGILTDRLGKLIDENLLDYIALDYKGSSLSLDRAIGLENYKSGKQLYSSWAESLELVKESSIDYELRTTLVKEIHSRDHLIKMAEELKGIFKDSQMPRWFLQNFERRSEILNDFTRREITLSSYSKEEMIEIKKELEKIIAKVSFRDTF